MKICKHQQPKPAGHRENQQGHILFYLKGRQFFLLFGSYTSQQVQLWAFITLHSLPSPWRPWSPDTDGITGTNRSSGLIFTQLLKTCKIKVESIWTDHWKRKKKPAIWGHKIFLSENRKPTCLAIILCYEQTFKDCFSLVLMSHFLTSRLWRLEAFWKWKANKIAFNALIRGYFRFFKSHFFSIF